MAGTANQTGARQGYRVPPPDAEDLIVWPRTFGTRFTIFVDTEEEFDWSAPLGRTGHETTSIAALPEAHRRFAVAGVPINYMIDYPIATDPAAVEVLQSVLADGQSAIGTQLHPWVNPPFDEELSVANSFVGNLPRALEAAKLDLLTATIAAAFGKRPIAFRAGRYGVGPATLDLLAEQGYRIDTSMRSGYDYSGEGGPDFTAIDNAAFRAGSAGRICELPLTTIYTGMLRQGGATLYRSLGGVPKGRGVFARARLLSRVALTPEDMPIADALQAIATAVGEGLQVLNFSFHSPSLVPGHTPYVRDAADLRVFHAWWDRVLDELARRGVQPVGLDELVAAALPVTPALR